MTADTATPRVRVQALGGYRIVVEGRDLRLRTRKEAMLLLRLAMAGENGISRDECIGMLWPESSEARARHSLSEALRGIELATLLEVRRTPDRLSLCESALAFDVREIEGAIAEGDVFECARLQTGEFLAGWYPPTAEASHWVDGVAASLAVALEKAMRKELAVRRQATDSRGVSAAVGVLERLGVATQEDREAGAEAEQITAWEALRPGETIHPRIPFDREGPFVGRVEEMRLLTSELERAMKGELRVVLVSGEAGIGKTRICQRLARIAALRGARLFLSTCYELEQSFAYGAIGEAFGGSVAPSDVAALKPMWRAALAELLPGLAHVYSMEESIRRPDQRSGEARLLQAASSLVDLMCKERTGLLLIDDAQWADAATCGLLHYLCRRSQPAAGILILIAARPIERDNNESLAALFRDLSGASIVLQSMSIGDTKSQIARLIPSLSQREVERIARRSGGNPLFAKELAIHDVGSPGELPPTIREVVLDRIQTLPPEQQQILAMIAVAGGQMQVGALGRTLRVSVADLLLPISSLREVGLIEEAGANISIVHGLVGASIYSSLGEALRRTYHGAISNADLQLSPAARARHLDLAGERRLAVDAAMQAASDASARYAVSETLDLLETAFRNADGTQRIEVAERFATACLEARHFGRLLAVLAQEEPASDTLKVRRDLAWLSRGNLKMLGGVKLAAAALDPLLKRAAVHSPQDFVAVAREKLRYAQEANDASMVVDTIGDLTAFARREEGTAAAAQALCVAAYQRAFYAPGVELEQSLVEALQIGERRGDPSVIVMARLGFAVCAVIQGRTNDVLRHAREALRLATTNGLVAEEVRAHACMASGEMDRMRFHRAIRHARLANGKGDAIDQWNPVMLGRLTATCSLLELDRLEQSVEEATDLLKMEQDHPDWLIRINGNALLCLALFRCGRLGEAHACAEVVKEAAASLSSWMDDPTYAAEALAVAAVHRGDRDEAVALADLVASGCEGRNRVGYWGATILQQKLTGAVDPERLALVRQQAAECGNLLLVHRFDSTMGPAQKVRSPS